VFTSKNIFVLLAFLYVAAAVPSTWNIIARTEGSTKAIEQILSTYNMKNEGEQALDRYTREHPILGMFFGSPIKKELELPSHEQSGEALSSDVTHLLKSVREESSAAAWWSWFFLSLSLVYVVGVIAMTRSLTMRPVLFALTSVSVFCFVIGILAPAMVIWTAPSIPMESGKLNFVLQHQVRGIAAIIWELLKTGHWIIGAFLLLFSILTPLTKVLLTFFVTASRSKDLNLKIGEVLHAIGKWSMADVFVAGVLLSLYALKAQEATKSIPCLGLYYFMGYCLLSMTTTELLMHSGAVAGNEKRSKRRLEFGLIGGLLVGVFCFVAASSLYTYEQYTVNIKESVKAPAAPEQLNNANLVLPAHK
jgi:paraquat-inducible protein A